MSQTEISRRQLLKALISTGGGLGVAFALPGKWLKPVVEVGVLPAHAQTSLPAPTQSNLQARGLQTQSAPSVVAPGPSFHIEFDFANASGGIVKVNTQFKWESANSPCGADYIPPSPTGTAGHYSYDQASPCQQDGCQCNVTVFFVDGAGRTSNPLTCQATNIRC